MVKVTQAYLTKHLQCSTNYIKHNQSNKNITNSISHLKLQQKFIDEIAEDINCPYVQTIYLHNNLLLKIPVLESFTRLTHLYLQRNRITKIQNLQSLVNLKKLYLGFNQIAVIEGLENQKILLELHVENQNISLGESLCFDPRSIRVLSKTLEFLNISGCGIMSLTPLMAMDHLQELKVTNNKLAVASNVTDVLKTMPLLTRLDIAGNAVTKLRHFTDDVIYASPNLKHFNARSINHVTRTFIDGWKTMQTTQKKVIRSTENEKTSEKLESINSLLELNTIGPSLQQICDTSKPVKCGHWKLIIKSNMPTKARSNRIVKKSLRFETLCVKIFYSIRYDTIAAAFYFIYNELLKNQILEHLNVESTA